MAAAGRARLLVIAAAAPPAAQAAAVPLPRPLRLSVPYVAGGGTGMVARLIAPALSAAVGQQVVIDHRPGGSSAIGTHIVARAAPDGQTLGIGEAGLAKVDTQTVTTLFAPIGVPASYVAGLNAAVMRASAAGGVRERFQSLGCKPETNAPAEAAARVRMAIEKWRAVIKASGAKAHGTWHGLTRPTIGNISISI